MTDRVVGYQSFQRASTPADPVFKSVKGWKEKGEKSTWWWTCFAVVPVVCCPPGRFFASCSANFVAPKLAQQIPQKQPNHTESLGYARSTVKRWLTKAKLQPFNKTLSDTAALIKENSSPTIQRINSWRLRASKHGFPALVIMAMRLLCMHPTARASEHNWSVWGQLHIKHRSRLAMEHARKLIRIRCNNKDFSEDDLESSLQPLAEENE